MTQDTYGSPVDATRDAIDVESLRHHSEPSRFALAVLVSGIALGGVIFSILVAFGPGRLLLAMLGLGAFVGSIWVLLQIARVRLLGSAVRVSPETFPDFQSAIDEVRERLDYRRRVDVYVVAKLPEQFQLTSYFGVRVLVVDGPSVADLTAANARPQLVFLLAIRFGALKARHARWAPALVVLESLSLLRFLNPFLRPWYRATVYTGDRIAYMCCRDLNVSLQAVHRLLVGSDMEPQLQAGGLLAQATSVRSSTVLRVSQLFMWEPHQTNRYLNLLAFAAAHEPAAVQQLRTGLPVPAQDDLDEATARLRPRRTSGTVATIGAVLAACVLVAAIVGGLVAHAGIDTPSSNPPPSDVPEPTPAPTATATDPPELGDADLLLARVPDGLREDCSPRTATDLELDGLLAALLCSPPEADTPDRVYYYSFEDDASAEAYFDSMAGELPDGACPTEWNTSGEWTVDDVEVGNLTCFDTEDSHHMAWTHHGEGVVVAASSESMDAATFFSWWENWANLEQE